MTCSLYRRCAPLLALLVMLAGETHAGMFSPCQDPTVLSGAKVQVFIFPYESERTLTTKGRALATVMQRHVLFAALKYRSIGVAELTESEGSCNYDQVAARVRARLRAGQTAIFVHGRVFEQASNIYLKSSVSVATDPDQAALSWSLAPQQQATAITTVPMDVGGFAPRTIPIDFLERLEPSQQQARKVHSAPDSNAAFRELPAGPSDRYTFLVLDARNDWMRIRVLPSGIEGWVPAHALATGQELKGEFPELHFVDALVGYYSLTKGAAGQERLLDLTQASLARYLQETESSRSESDPRALALLLMGNSRLRAAPAAWTTATLQAARDDYRRSTAASPSWTPAQSHLLACTALLCARGACGDDAGSLEARYLEAIGRDPTSRELLDGLSAYYDAVTAGRLPSTQSPEGLANQRAKLRSVQARMPSR
jgi:hypothetical protein